MSQLRTSIFDQKKEINSRFLNIQLSQFLTCIFVSVYVSVYNKSHPSHQNKLLHVNVRLHYKVIWSFLFMAILVY